MVPELIGAPDYTLFQNNFVQCMSALPLHVPEMVRSSNSAIINCFILIKKKPTKSRELQHSYHLYKKAPFLVRKKRV